MREGEEAHSRGELDRAIKGYKRALELDPKLYLAALFTGDMYFKKGMQANDAGEKKEMMAAAGEWFERAIAIDENIETAHRYWGDALEAEGRLEEARDRFVDAIIAEPYGRRAYVGLTQWGKRHQVSLGHPRIDIPPT
jgi:tetratricopeptide (TPR) repeat protein